MNYNLCLSTLKDYMGLHHTGKSWDEDKDKCHTSLCALGANWLVRVHKCKAVLVERGSLMPEMPDVIGFYHSDSFLIEAKLSRGDFLADAKKKFRQEPGSGMGKYRYYICPKDLIKAEELPDNWGLLYVSAKGIVKKVREATPYEGYNRDAEYIFLVSAISTPWKLFQHWTESALERLFKIKWVDARTEVDLKLFAARLSINRISENYND